MLIHVFLLMKNPGERQNHKCTHFNIINIIWLPLCSPWCPGFYLPMAAEEESENRFYMPCAGSSPCELPAWQKSNSLSSQTQQTGTETRNSSAPAQETSLTRQQTCSGWVVYTQPCWPELSLPWARLSPRWPPAPWLHLAFICLPSEQPVAWITKPGNHLSQVVPNMTKSHLACSSVQLIVLAFFIHFSFPCQGKDCFFHPLEEKSLGC